ncbi:glycoside hydrolase family 16 protein [Sphingobacterium hungaricum]|uniref:Glycoside hydrolase n=1 Tax=Sphingobacterium hungaricum TaxID=2082723 RepID=A0A928YR67_9SPHI|nr:glycoside hydrolase family 16 protein [Sphingobacterium hungaricum]MBE8714674.1 glycoside hydrolase [Sphingobacterium hungaricum]
MKSTAYLLLSVLFLLSCRSAKQLSGEPFSNKPAWSDEFNSDGMPDSSKWQFDIGMGENGWGNNEKQYYVQDQKNVSIENGFLKITATKEQQGKAAFHSTKIHSKGKGDFLYGRMEVRAKVPTQRGTWPAVWMMPSKSVYGGWPKSGEIDIMEHVGFDPNVMHTTMHMQAFNGMKGNHKTASKLIPTATSAFHTYRVDWTPEYINGYIDDELFFTYQNPHTGSEEWPFDQEFYFIINLAIGGNWGGSKGIDEGSLPAELLVDYIRYYPYLPKK